MNGDAPVQVGYIKGIRYEVRFNKLQDGGAEVRELRVLGHVYTPEGAGFVEPEGHRTERGVTVVRRQPHGRYAVIRPETGEPATSTTGAMDFDDACEFAAKQAAAAVLRDRDKRGI